MKYTLPFTGKRNPQMDDGSVIVWTDVEFQGKKYILASLDLHENEIIFSNIKPGDEESNLPDLVGIRMRVAALTVELGTMQFKWECTNA